MPTWDLLPTRGLSGSGQPGCLAHLCLVSSAGSFRETGNLAVVIGSREQQVTGAGRGLARKGRGLNGKQMPPRSLGWTLPQFMAISIPQTPAGTRPAGGGMCRLLLAGTQNRKVNLVPITGQGAGLDVRQETPFLHPLRACGFVWQLSSPGSPDGCLRCRGKSPGL